MLGANLTAYFKKENAVEPVGSSSDFVGPSTGFALKDQITDTKCTGFNDNVPGSSSEPSKFKYDRGRFETVESEIIDEENEDDGDFPEGGWRAYLVVFGSFMATVPIFGILNSLGAIQSYVATHQLQDVNSSTVSWIFSIYCSICFFSCVISGGYFDRNGSRTPMIVGSLLFVAGFVAVADCKEVYQFILAFSILSGMGAGIIMTPSVGVIATWFKKNRAIATSCATVGGSIGGVIIPLMLRKLYVEVGFTWAMRIFALFSGVCCFISLFLAKERTVPHSKPFTSRKEAIDFYLTSAFNWRYMLDAKFVLTSLGCALAESALTCALTFVSSYSMMLGNSETLSYNLLTASNACGILGRYLPGYLADKYMGRFNIMITTISLSIFLQLVVWLPFGNKLKALWAFVCLYGFSTGSIFSLTPVCIGQISRTVDFGKRYSTAYFIQALLTLPVLPIGGVIVGDGSVESYKNFIIFCSMVMLAGNICFIGARYNCVGWRLCKF